MAKGRKYAEYHKFYVSGDAGVFFQMPFFFLNKCDNCSCKISGQCAILVMLKVQNHLLCIPLNVGRIMLLVPHFSDRLVGNLLGSVCF